MSNAYTLLAQKEHGKMVGTTVLDRDLEKDLFLKVGIDGVHNPLYIDVSFFQDTSIPNEDINLFLKLVRRAVNEAYLEGIQSIRKPLMKALGFEIMSQETFQEDEDLKVVIVERGN
jgi:hypothetical protein